MHWLDRPPYVKWAFAALLVIAAMAWDVSSRATEAYPFAAVDIPRGQFVTDADIEWRQMPSSSLVQPELTGAAAAVDIAAGEPLVASLIAPRSAMPDDSWAVPMALPLGTAPGMAVRLVFSDGTSTPGVIVQPAEQDSIGLTSDGLVAVDGSVADAVALAASNGEVVVLFQP